MVISFLVEKMFVIEYVLIMLPLPEFFSHQLDIPNFLPLLSFYLQRKKKFRKPRNRWEKTHKKQKPNFTAKEQLRPSQKPKESKVRQNVYKNIPLSSLCVD